MTGSILGLEQLAPPPDRLLHRLLQADQRHQRCSDRRGRVHHQRSSEVRQPFRPVYTGGEREVQQPGTTVTSSPAETQPVLLLSAAETRTAGPAVDQPAHQVPGTRVRGLQNWRLCAGG